MKGSDVASASNIVQAEPIDGNQSRKPLASGELVVAPDGNVGTIVNLWSHARNWGFEKGACVEFREDWRVDYPVSQLRRPLVSAGRNLADAHSKSPSRPAMPKEEDTHG